MHQKEKDRSKNRLCKRALRHLCRTLSIWLAFEVPDHPRATAAARVVNLIFGTETRMVSVWASPHHLLHRIGVFCWFGSPRPESPHLTLTSWPASSRLVHGSFHYSDEACCNKDLHSVILYFIKDLYSYHTRPCGLHSTGCLKKPATLRNSPVF